MSYSRKQFDKHKLKKLAHESFNGFLGGCWYSERKHYYIRFYKSRGRNSNYALHKRYYHKRMRRFANKYGWYSKKEYDLMWHCW